MRKYLFGTGLLSAVTTGFSLLRASRETSFTWRVALSWLSWGITLALAIGAIVDTYRASRGYLVAEDSPTAKNATKLLKEHLDR